MIHFIKPLASADAVAVPQGAAGVVDGAAATQVMMIGAAIQNRAQALAQLRIVAEFFRATEPHSPVAYLADKAAHWGELPLHLWLRSVIKDPAAIADLDELLGAADTPQ